MTGSTNIKYTFIADIDNALKGFKQVTDQFTKMSKDASKLGKDFSSTTSKMSSGLTSLSKGFRQASDRMSQFSTQMKSATKEAGLLKTSLTALTGVAIGKFLADSTKESINFVENMNLFKVAMKDSLKEGQEFIAMMQEVYGLDPSYLARTTGLFYEMAYAVDMPSEAAKKLALNMTAMSTDIGSLFNVDFETVADNMTSGLRGMSRAVVKYGMDLRASTVEAYANAHGITAQFETMSEANREILRYLVMVEQAEDANSDFARTITSPANQLRILKEQLAQLGRAIGNYIVQPLSVALPYITGFVMALRMLLNAIAELLGFMRWTESSTASFGSSLEDVSTGVSGIGSAAGDAAKQINKMLAPFDELNIISEQASGAGAGVGAGVGTGVDPQLLKLLEESEYKMEGVRLKANEVRDAILGFMGISIWQEFDEDTGRMITRMTYMADVFENNLIAKFPQWEKSIHALFDVDWKDAWKQLKGIASTLATIAKLSVSRVVDDVLALFGINDSTLSSAIAGLNDNLSGMYEWLQQNKDMLIETAARIMEMWLAWQVLTAVAGIVGGIAGGLGSVLSVLSTLASAGAAILAPLGTIIGGVSTAFSLMFQVLGAGLTKVMGPLGSFVSKLPVIGNLVTNLSGVLSTLAGIFSGPLAIAISGATTLFAALFVGGFVKWAATSERFGELLGSIFTHLGDVFTHFGELVQVVVAAFIAGIDFMATHFSSTYEAIVAIIDWIIIVFDGLIEFITGVFTGDWEKVLQGLAKIVGGIMGAIMSGIVAVLNAGITVIEMALSFIVNALYDFIKGALSIVESAASIVGIDLDFPESIDIKLPRIPTPDPVKFATGGVVTGPTNALIGEGRYDEAVIPLGDSPQMQELVDRIADQAGKPVDVRVYIGDREWDTFVYESAERGKDLSGEKPIKSTS